MELSEKHPASIDVLVTDVIMPMLSGPELAQSLAKQRPSVKVLYISGYTDDKLRGAKIADADVVLMSKPFQLAELALKLRQVLQGPTING